MYRDRKYNGAFPPKYMSRAGRPLPRWSPPRRPDESIEDYAGRLWTIGYTLEDVRNLLGLPDWTPPVA